MQIQQIRSATVRISCGDRVFLTDPWLADKGGMGCFRDLPFRFDGLPFRCCTTEQTGIPMPICELPMPREQVLSGVDACILTHVHPDHIDIDADGTVGRFLDRTVPIFVQSMEDAHVLVLSGFKDVTVLYEDTTCGSCELIRTPARHGTKIPCGPACGVILRSRGEPTLYIAGDTIWYSAVRKTIDTYHPDVILLNACAAELVDQGRLIMDDGDVESVCNAAPRSRIIVSHMDNVAHATLTRTTMRERLKQRGILDRVLMPDDGETLTF